MPVSGLVVLLSEDPKRQAEAISAIGDESQITVGRLEGNRLAIVLDTPTELEDKRMWQWLHSIPGVTLVEVAFVGFESSDDASTSDDDEISIQTRQST